MNSMTHELRTPLNGIIGLSESVLIGSCGAVSNTVSKVINTIKNSGGRLLSLINDILDAASMRKVGVQTELGNRGEDISVRRPVLEFGTGATPRGRWPNIMAHPRPYPFALCFWTCVQQYASDVGV